MKNLANIESRIVHETKNFYAFLLDSGRIQIRMHNGTHSIVAGECRDIDHARRTMQRFEMDPESIRKFLLAG